MLKFIEYRLGVMVSAIENLKVQEFIRSHRVARLATADVTGTPHVVPICYVYDEDHVYLALDKKPKKTDIKGLKRVKNILENPKVCLVIDDYIEDWERLAFVILHGNAELVERGPEQKRAIEMLKGKYRQYIAMGIDESPVIKITIEKTTAWGEGLK